MQSLETTEGTLAPGEENAEGGLPQMNPETFASQLFWLVLMFGVLFFVISKMALPRIGAILTTRRETLAGDLEKAEQLRKDAAGALAGYEAALAGARGRAGAMADENRKRTAAEIEKLSAAADAQTQTTLAEAEQRIYATRKTAAGHVQHVASEAAADIVERLIGERVSASDALRAVQSSRG